MKIGKSIKDLRKSKGLTQKEFAKILEISQAYLSGIETDDKMPSMPTILMIAEALGVNPYIFFISCAENDPELNDRPSFRHTMMIIKDLLKLVHLKNK